MSCARSRNHHSPPLSKPAFSPYGQSLASQLPLLLAEKLSARLKPEMNDEEHDKMVKELFKGQSLLTVA